MKFLFLYFGDIGEGDPSEDEYHGSFMIEADDIDEAKEKFLNSLCLKGIHRAEIYKGEMIDSMILPK